MTLLAVTDPADGDLALFTPAPRQRFVAFDILIYNWRGAGETVPVTTSAFRLTTDDGRRRRPVLPVVAHVPGRGFAPDRLA